MTESVIFTQKGDIASVVLNQSSNLNAFGTDLVEGLHATLDQAEQQQAKFWVLKANGKGFSGGLDLSGLESETDGDLLLRLVRIEQLLQRVRHSSLHSCVMVHGACYGAAADLVLCCRFRVSSPDARFLMPGLRFGIVLGTRRLRDTLGETAAYRLLNRQTPFKANEALETGFLNAVADQSGWDQLIQEQVHRLSIFDQSSIADRVSSLTPDTRDADMTALVTSVLNGSIKLRMQQYVAEVSASKKKR